MIFITGYPRSGTTLISNKIGSTDDIYIGPETNYYRKFYNQFNISDKQFFLNAVADKRLSDYNLSEEELKEVARKSNYNKHQFLSEFLHFSARKYNSKHKLVIEKSPAHILYYRRIISDNPDSKFIFITRDPRDVINSNLNVDWIHSNIHKHAVAYKLYYQAFLNLKADFPDRVLHIRYEDFLRNDSEMVEKAFNFISPDIKIESGIETSLKTVPEWEMSWKSESLKPINKSKVFLWKSKKNEKVEKSVQLILNDVLINLNYELTTHTISLKDKAVACIYNNPFYKNFLLFRRKFFP